MSFAIFNQKKDNTGGAVIAKLTQDNAVLLSLFRQVNNDEKNRKNNFAFKTPLNIKLSEDEIGDIIRVIRMNGAFKFYHTFDKDKTTGSFNYYEIEQTQRRGFGLTVTKNDVTVKVGFSLGAAERFSEYLKFCLSKSFEASLIDDRKKEQEFKERKASSSASTPSKSDSQTSPVTDTGNNDGVESSDF